MRRYFSVRNFLDIAYTFPWKVTLVLVFRYFPKIARKIEWYDFVTSKYFFTCTFLKLTENSLLDERLLWFFVLLRTYLGTYFLLNPNFGCQRCQLVSNDFWNVPSMFATLNTTINTRYSIFLKHEFSKKLSSDIHRIQFHPSGSISLFTTSDNFGATLIWRISRSWPSDVRIGKSIWYQKLVLAILMP